MRLSRRAHVARFFWVRTHRGWRHFAHAWDGAPLRIQRHAWIPPCTEVIIHTCTRLVIVTSRRLNWFRHITGSFPQLNTNLFLPKDKDLGLDQALSTRTVFLILWVCVFFYCASVLIHLGQSLLLILVSYSAKL